MKIEIDLTYDQQVALFKKAEENGGRWFVDIRLAGESRRRTAYILSLPHAIELFCHHPFFAVYFRPHEGQYEISWSIFYPAREEVILWMYVDPDVWYKITEEIK
jgi:hypothetical protein